MSATRICPPSAAAQSRAASITGVPKQSSSSQATSPRLIPTRMASGAAAAPAVVPPSIACWIATAAADRVGRARERGHDAVADALRDRAVVRRDRVGEQPVVRAPQRLGRLLAELRALRGRADEVGEEDRRGAGGACGRLRGHRGLPTSPAP